MKAPLLLLALLLATSALHAELPPAAQEAINKGVIAAKQKDFAQAIQLFEKARRLAPTAPEVFYNLGLAESKIPGRELRAMAWFGAYLTAYADAPNAAAVKDQIVTLEVRNKSNLSRLLKTVEEAALALPENERPSGLIMPDVTAGGALQDAAVLWVDFGDSAAARRIAALYRDSIWKARALGAIGIQLVRHGDKASAREAFSLALRTDKGAAMGLAASQANIGEIAEAQKTASLLKDPWSRNWAEMHIANAQTKSGDLTGARQTIAAALKRAAPIKVMYAKGLFVRPSKELLMKTDSKDEANNSDTFRDIGMAQAAVGDLEDAVKSADSITVESWKNEVLATVTAVRIRRQAESGDIAGALAAAERIGKDNGSALQEIAMVQAKSGRYADAQKTVELIEVGWLRNDATTAIDRIAAPLHQGSAKTSVAQWIIMNSKVLKAPIFLDLTTALNDLPKSDPQGVFKALKQMAGEIIEQSQQINLMLKQQAVQPEAGFVNAVRAEQARQQVQVKLASLQAELGDVAPFVASFYIDNGITLVPIPAGEFMMGSPGNETGHNSDEGPQTRVTISRLFFISETEMTQEQWKAVMGSNPSYFKGDELPVEQVSWNDAMEFCRKLTERERAAGRLPEGWMFTLPTEAQWEYACRAGTTGAYAGSLIAMAWYDNKTHAVGTKQANTWGLHDMHGNVYEWCLDRYANSYPGGNVTDPTGNSSGSRRVYRGGGWGYGGVGCRSAQRIGSDPDGQRSCLGFRLALSSVR